jgi:hypothetical protein
MSDIVIINKEFRAAYQREHHSFCGVLELDAPAIWMVSDQFRVFAEHLFGIPLVEAHPPAYYPPHRCFRN